MQATPILHVSDPFLRMPDVIREVGLSKSTIYNLIQQQQFPPPTAKLGPRVSVWKLSKINEWKEKCIAESQTEAK